MVLPGLTRCVLREFCVENEKMIKRKIYSRSLHLSFSQYMSSGVCRKSLAIILFLFPENLHADIIICKLGDYFENRFGYSYLFIDDSKMTAKLGTGNSWGETVRAARKSIAIGEKIYFSYSGYDNSYRRNTRFQFSLRIRKEGDIDLLDYSANGHNSRIKNSLECKKT